ncbi:twin-arginine translocase TatA/TatE family subunit [Frischella japonica]
MMPSWPNLLILVAVIVLIFGTKKLRTLGSDLGASIKGFKKAMDNEDDNPTSNNDANFSAPSSTHVEKNHDKKE